jgi:hypothetical protein
VIRQVPEPANICFKSMEFLIYFIDWLRAASLEFNIKLFF